MTERLKLTPDDYGRLALIEATNDPAELAAECQRVHANALIEWWAAETGQQ